MPPIRLLRGRGKGLSKNEEISQLSFLQKLSLKRSKTHGPWVLVNLAAATILLLDVWLGEYTLSKAFTEGTQWVYVGCVLELVACCAVGVNLFAALAIVLKPYFGQNWIFVSMKQRKLLGIKDRESGFKTLLSKPTATSTPLTSPTAAYRSQMGERGSLNLDWLFRLKKSPLNRPTIMADRSSMSQSWNASAQWSIGSPTGDNSVYSPRQRTPIWCLSSTQSIPQSYDTPSQFSTSFGSTGYSPGQRTPTWSFNSSPPSFPESYGTPSHVSSTSFVNDQASSFGRQDTSDYILCHSERKPTFSESLLRMRRAKSSSPFLKGREIYSKKELRKYLDDFDRKNRIEASKPVVYFNQTTYELGTVVLADPTGICSESKFPAVSMLDPSADGAQVKEGLPVPILKRIDSGGKDLGAPRHLSRSSSMSPWWFRYDLEHANLDLYIQNIRLWISRTILKPLVREIEKLNQKFDAQSRQDLRIGDASLASLRHVLLGRPTEFEGLEQLIPYLELTSSQQYLVQRTKDLASDACMYNFKWNSGGREKVGTTKDQTRAWDDHLPTDAKLIWHFLATYLDSKIPANPFCADSKNFSSRYFLAYPGKLQTGDLRKAPDAVYVYQKSESPPHFQLTISGGKDSTETIDVGPGRNNLLLTIVLFLQHLKLNCGGYLGPVSTGTAGLNVQWTLES